MRTCFGAMHLTVVFKWLNGYTEKYKDHMIDARSSNHYNWSLANLVLQINLQI